MSSASENSILESRLVIQAIIIFSEFQLNDTPVFKKDLSNLIKPRNQLLLKSLINGKGSLY